MSNPQDNLVEVKNVSKGFKLPHENSSGLKQLLINRLKGKKGYEIQDVLKDITFDIKRGEFFGIVGRNGSGKSTLLKLLANIYEPDSGTLAVNGSLTPFIELGVGFNPELTGRENVFMNGALLGFSHKEVLEMYDGIVEFAELPMFMDQKLKNYSSGMQVRLAFSIAIRAQSDILLIDEVLAVGDAAFQQKCFDYFRQVKQEKKTIIFVSHDMESVKKYCDRALYISKGEITKIGTPKEIAKIYERDNNEQISLNTKSVKNNSPLNIATKSKNGSSKKLFEYNEPMTIQFKWNQNDIERIPDTVGVAIFKDSQHIYGVNTTGQTLDLKKGTTSHDIDLNLGPGKYKIVAGLFGPIRDDVIIFNSEGPEFVVNSSNQKHELDWDGVTQLEVKWN